MKVYVPVGGTGEGLGARVAARGDAEVVAAALEGDMMSITPAIACNKSRRRMQLVTVRYSLKYLAQ